MHTTYKKILITIFMVLLVAPSMAANTTSYCGITAKGPYNILVSLGLEYIVPLDWAYLIYNMIGIGLLYLAMATASQRNMRFFAIIIPILAGMLAYFGWYNNYGSTVSVWPMIIATGMIGFGIYLKDTNREKWGSGGSGSTLVNFVFYIILLQSCVGLVNSSNLWQVNTAPTPTQYQNVDLEQQIGGINNTGGFWGNAITMVTMVGVMAIQSFMLIISILATIAAFSVVVIFCFPFLAASPFALAVLAVVQIIVWLLYLWMWFIMTYKPPAIDQIGVG